MFVSVHRVRKNGEVSKPVEIVSDVESLDQAEEIFNEKFRHKYPEHWGWEFQDMDKHDPLFQLLAAV